MSIKANIKVGGSTTIQVEGETPIDIIKGASQFTQLPRKCGHCGSTDLGFMHRSAGDAGEYDYLHLKCGECGAQADLGQTKSPKGGVFFKHQPDRTGAKDGFYKFWEQPKSGGGGTAAPAAPSPAAGASADSSDDDIPF
jgi:hypothetical protein